ncbi:DUF4132 domain-containing protein [Nocardia sp. NPDC127526]|uniref:DUF4132 domain-containing protein n=1 Tax=Nocardia sp. NPDC127526 TaxID=3345393 RepID=UPI003630A352
MLDAATTFGSDQAAEDRWEAPRDWWALATPTRGLGPQHGPAVRSEIFDRATVPAAQQGQITGIFERTAASGATDLAEAGAEALRDAAACTPLGAAVLSLAVEQTPDHSTGVAVYYTADDWVRERGISFAAEAAALRTGLACDGNFDFTTRRYNLTLRRFAPGEIGAGAAPDALFRMRARLAAAPEEQYREAVARLAGLRTAPATVSVRVATSFLVPSESDWVAADLEELPPSGGGFLSLLPAASVTDRAALERVTRPFGANVFLYDQGRQLLYSMLTRLGPDCAGMLDRMLRDRDIAEHSVRQVSDILSRFPTDEAFGVLVARADQRFVLPALIAAAQRFPRRALRLLRPAADRSPLARMVLRTLAYARPEVRAELPAIVAFVDPRARTAAQANLPEILRNPPWQGSRKATKPVVIRDIAPHRPGRLTWADGEREEWAGLHVHVWHNLRSNPAETLAEALRNYRPHENMVPHMFAVAAEDLVRPHLATVVPGRPWNCEAAFRRILARFGEDAVNYVLRAVQSNPTNLIPILGPVTGTEVTQSMSRWLDGKKTRPLAFAWFDRNLAAALPDLIATALEKAGKARGHAESALRALAQRGHRAAIESAAARFGERVAAAMSELLDADPLLQLPAKIPALPNWLEVRTLPALLMRADDAPVPTQALEYACTMLAMSGPNGDYAGVAHLRAAADPDALAEFAWGLLEAWRLADYPSKDGWVLHALGLLGTDETARRLGPLIRLWPGQAGHARAVSGLDVLTAIGTDAALMQLHGIAEKSKFKGLETKAQEKITEVAADLGLTAEQLADRLVPEFGLDADGTLVLDYGPRAFVIGFDEQLAPTISDAIRGEDGWRPAGRRKSLPKPGAKDDPEQAAAAYKAFSALKKDVKSAAADQIRRFERAMVSGRRWPADEHRRLFVDHPLLWHLSRRLIWATFDENGCATASFRIAEDRSYADTADDIVMLPEDAAVGIAHPLHLGDARTAWGEIFADYEILQPFPQLQREIYACTEEERRGSVLPEFQDRTVPTGKILGLSRFGWDRSAPQDGGVSTEMVRVLGGGRSLVIDLEPGIIAGLALEFDEQKIGVRLASTGHEDYWERNNHTAPIFADLDPMTISEALRELSHLS